MTLIDNRVKGTDTDTGSDTGSDAPVNGDELVRQGAIKQIQRRRHFHIEVIASAIGMAILVAIWAVSEYHNAGGWPTQGFSQSSGIHDVWNFWIVYPIVGWMLILSARGWSVYGRKPISESEIKREIERQTGAR
ncbi:MAG TPA: 2TM domain-containing protein [Acidimicrobiales bacterium]|nr:2TM domain-containing protein [Acidimicrobiales bacterium]